MTLKEFAANLRDELVVFLKARFGRDWQAIVARQAGVHPRCFERWRRRPPTLPYHLHKLEQWARSIGFVSATDERLKAALEAQEKFRQAAGQAAEDAQRKRNEAALEAKELDYAYLKEQFAEGLKRFRERGDNFPPSVIGDCDTES